MEAPMDDGSMALHRCTVCWECFTSELEFVSHSRLFHCIMLISQGENTAVDDNYTADHKQAFPCKADVRRFGRTKTQRPEPIAVLYRCRACEQCLLRQFEYYTHALEKHCKVLACSGSSFDDESEDAEGCDGSRNMNSSSSSICRDGNTQLQKTIISVDDPIGMCRKRKASFNPSLGRQRAKKKKIQHMAEKLSKVHVGVFGGLKDHNSVDPNRLSAPDVNSTELNEDSFSSLSTNGDKNCKENTIYQARLHLWPVVGRPRRSHNTRLKLYGNYLLSTSRDKDRVQKHMCDVSLSAVDDCVDSPQVDSYSNTPQLDVCTNLSKVSGGTSASQIDQCTNLSKVLGQCARLQVDVHTITPQVDVHTNTSKVWVNTSTLQVDCQTSTSIPQLDGHTSHTITSKLDDDTSMLQVDGLTNTLQVEGYTSTSMVQLNGHTHTSKPQVNGHTSHASTAKVDGHTTTPKVDGHAGTPQVNGNTSTCIPQVDDHTSNTSMSKVEGHASTPQVDVHTSTSKIEGHTIQRVDGCISTLQTNRQVRASCKNSHIGSVIHPAVTTTTHREVGGTKSIGKMLLDSDLKTFETSECFRCSWRLVGRPGQSRNQIACRVNYLLSASNDDAHSSIQRVEDHSGHGSAEKCDADAALSSTVHVVLMKLSH
ncbi:PREDICTED: uncharacterized protein LOC106812085 [Priapulus caudatus]|uniref:Uncharacterized protein LOC106812085 n=1 Tax=Priapulus caudatus TaxID=37621 RepID=A0ABM1EGL5_PRICU|nr:PREDICTED: uncharacterized protein LOC106812085 [Priapulus caudatus]XP_014671335.1 PREDICTED: uncharacterized protein LOC106812085 [Priapulus caudatus]XP_014671336.1 PREDICTED: uncharacterized protein LOC106812085 [Priapulus caudatus]XP_014671337.1 PREDICTED: uncharacterized protein LOC106812085 [Priapulus caudatus]XP_014671338.1 PREDICTED: uncharacterized protein LOC106812085 [Priapulus caudatus]